MPDEANRQPATKQDIAELKEALAEFRAHTDQGFAELRAHTDQGLAKLNEGLAEVRQDLGGLAARLERAENTLLTGFHTYARREGIRTQALEARLHEVEQFVLSIQEQLGRRQ